VIPSQNNKLFGILLSKFVRGRALMSDKNILGFLFPHPRFAPTIFAIFIGSIFLLFLQNLGYSIRTYLIPSIFVYAMATALVGTFHRLLALHYSKSTIIVETSGDDKKSKVIELEVKGIKEGEKTKRKLAKYNEVEIPGGPLSKILDLSNNERTIPLIYRISIGVVHLILFVLLLIYNFHHNSLSW
jgi:hypothetical protein